MLIQETKKSVSKDVFFQCLERFFSNQRPPWGQTLSLGSAHLNLCYSGHFVDPLSFFFVGEVLNAEAAMIVVGQKLQPLQPEFT